MILLDRRLCQADRRVTLAHELAHVFAEDRWMADVSPLLHARQEARAHVRAARSLITVDALVDALLWSRDEGEMAEELNVDVDTVRTRLATLTEDEHEEIDERLWAAEETA